MERNRNLNAISAQASKELLEVAHELADSARAPILRHFRSRNLAVDNKSSDLFDPVTDADRAAETAIRDRLAKLRPQDGIIGEEYGNSEGASGLIWVVDPIDGTRSFIAGMPVWTVIIGLHDGICPVLGIIDQPYLDERFWGIGVEGLHEACFRHGVVEKPLRTSQCADLGKASISTTHRNAFERPEDYTAFQTLERSCRLSRMGGDAYQYAMLAHGGFDLVVESGLNSYDILGVIPIVEGAGGKITDWEGGSCAWGGKVIAACNSSLHRIACEALASAEAAQDVE